MAVRVLTLITTNRFLDRLPDTTLCRNISSLSLERRANIAVATLIHRFLQRAVFPAKEVVAVLTVASSDTLLASSRIGHYLCDLPVAHRVHKRLRSVLWPDALVIERCGVPHDFVHQLWHLDWM